MRNENMRELIESELSETIESGLNADEALAEAAGLISEAEARFVKLSRPALSVPPPRR